MATVIEYYAVMCENDGYSSVSDYEVARFLSRPAADEFAERNKYYYVSSKKKTFVVYDSVEQYDHALREKAKAVALAKFTAEERAI